MLPSKRWCPRCKSEAICKSNRPGESFYCWSKIGGYDAKFGDIDTAITSQRVGLEPNLEIANNVNTLLKMSQKRAFECGIFYAAGISEFFSQDLEDMLMAALCSHDSTNF